MAVINSSLIFSLLSSEVSENFFAALRALSLPLSPRTLNVTMDELADRHRTSYKSLTAEFSDFMTRDAQLRELQSAFNGIYTHTYTHMCMYVYIYVCM